MIKERPLSRASSKKERRKVNDKINVKVIRKQRREYRERNPERVLDIHKEYRKNNLKSIRDKERQRRYGEYWECHLLICEIQKEFIIQVPDKYDRKKDRQNIRNKIEQV